MVLDEGDSPSAIVAVVVVVAHKRPVVIVLLPQFEPAGSVGSIADNISELEVEGGGCRPSIHFGSIYPVAYGGCSIPALTYGIFHASMIVIVGNVGATESLYHVIAETCVAEVVDEVFDIGHDDGLHVAALMVEVAHSSPSFTFIVVATQRYTILLCLCGSTTTIVVGYNVGSLELICHTLVCLCRERPPAVGVMMVHYHVGNSPETFGFEGVDHRAQLCLCSETTVLVEVVIGCIAHCVVRFQALAALWYPYQVEVGCQLVGLRLQIGPLRVSKRVPIKSLKHHATIVSRPSLYVGSRKRNGHQ